MKMRIGQVILASFLAATSMVGYALPVSFTVDSYLNSSTGGVGVDTGINLAAGEQLTVSVSPDDLWNAGSLPRWSNADGLLGDLYATGSDESGQPLGTYIGMDWGLHSQYSFSFYYATLVGELSGTYFEIGTNFSGPAPAAGTLNLYYWDSYREDNQGSVVATIQQRLVDPEQVGSVPEPGTLLLMALGLAGFALRFRARAA
jgi:hypothetical protein